MWQGWADCNTAVLASNPGSAHSKSLACLTYSNLGTVHSKLLVCLTTVRQSLLRIWYPKHFSGLRIWDNTSQSHLAMRVTVDIIQDPVVESQKPKETNMPTIMNE